MRNHNGQCENNLQNYLIKNPSGHFKIPIIHACITGLCAVAVQTTFF